MRKVFQFDIESNSVENWNFWKCNSLPEDYSELALKKKPCSSYEVTKNLSQQSKQKGEFAIAVVFSVCIWPPKYTLGIS